MASIYPKKTELPVIKMPHERSEIVAKLAPNHGYSIAEAAYLLNITPRHVSRAVSKRDGTDFLVLSEDLG